MDFDFTKTAAAAFYLVGLLFIAVVIPYVRSRTSGADWDKLSKMANTAVRAAEQLYRESGMGKKKKEAVLQWFANRHIKIDPDKLDSLIEEAVFNLKNENKKELKKV